MHRTQIYIDDELWTTLQRRAAAEQCSISELIRNAARTRYSVDKKKRAAAARAAIGLWKDHDEINNSEGYLRDLRQGNTRRKRLEA